MLRAFFDESGHHDDDGGLLQLTLGGCIATVKAWESFERNWAAFLERNSIGWFHSTKFANVTKHRSELDEAAQILKTSQIFCYGSTIFIPDAHRPAQPKRVLQNYYEDGLVDMIWNAARHADAVNDDIELVFALHGDFSLNKVQEQFGAFQKVDQCLRGVLVGEPRTCLPLQAADLVAYWAQRLHRAEILNEADDFRSVLGILEACLEWKMTPPALSRRFYLENPPSD